MGNVDQGERDVGVSLGAAELGVNEGARVTVGERVGHLEVGAMVVPSSVGLGVAGEDELGELVAGADVKSQSTPTSSL